MAANGNLNRRLLGIGLLVGGGVLAREISRRRNALELGGKVVLITGSSRGLGYLLAREFARNGARVVMCARGEGVLREAAADVEALGAEVLAMPCDVRDPQQVQRLVDAAVERFGRLDVVVNNAGIITMAPLDALQRSDFEDAMNTIFWGSYNASMAALPYMRKLGTGRIVNITSIGGKIAAPHLLAYTAAKFAMVGFSEGLRSELAREGIGVVTVVPGFMRTGSHLNASFKGRHRQEFTWFSLMGNLPFTSTDARKAARRIVKATRLGEPEVIITPQAQLAARFHGALPGTNLELLSLVGRLMPKPGGTEEAVPGKESQTALSDSFLTSLGERAAEEYHQVPGR